MAPPPPPPPGPPPPPPPKVPGPPPPPIGKGKPRPMMSTPTPTPTKSDNSSTPSFWNNASDRMEDLRSEFGNLEDLFGAKKPLLKAEGSFIFPMSPAGSLDDKPNKATTVTLLDFKRVQTLSILLSRVKMSNEDIRTAILSFDAQKFSPEDLNNLHKNAPTSDEIETLRSYPDDPSTLGKPEQFFLTIMDIPRLTQKLEAFLFTQKFASQVEELNPDIETLSQACTQLKGSEKFAKVLELVLALGNFVNGGTFRGGFFGFKLDSLLQLQDVKSPADHKTSLLHYFGRLLREKYSDLLNFADELPALENAKRISLQTVSSEVGTLRKELRAACQEAESSKADDSQSFSIALTSALEQITPQFELVEAKLAEVQKEFVDLVTYFGDDPKTTTPEDFFSIVTRFTTQLEAVHKDAANEKERAEREAKRAYRKSATGTPLKSLHSSLLPSTPSTPMAESETEM